VRRTLWPAAAFGLLAIFIVLWGGVAGAATSLQKDDPTTPKDLRAELAEGDELPDNISGVYDFARADFGTGLTQCPQAGLNDQALEQPTNDPLAAATKHSDNIRLSQDYSCFPQDETSVAVNPTNSKNVIAGANDYRNGFGSSGFYSTTDGGKAWYDGVKPFPSPDNGNDHLDGGGDPAVAFDRQGTAYYADIHFDRTDLTNGVFVARSTNGGFTWSKPCVALNTANPPTDAGAVCGGNGDPRTPNDGTVQYFLDDGSGLTPQTDKEYVTTGPRPAGVSPTCFAPVSKTPIAAGATGCPNDVIGPDRVYVTWTLFDTGGCATATGPGQHCSVPILEAYSDDRGHSFSPPHQVTGTAPFCLGIFGDNSCDDSQASTPTVSSVDGTLYVAYENFNTPDENQYLVSKSTDGGQTFTGPFFVSTVFDVNDPLSSGDPDPAAGNRPDCGARGQGDGRRVLTNSCFRIDSFGNMVVDKRGGAFKDDLYLAFGDNRDGSMQSSNNDVFFFKSTNGGLTWTGPTRVNDDASRAPDVATEGGRDCGRILGRVCPATVPNFGNDQFFPWLDISAKGMLFVGWEDRRLDTSTTVSEWPTSMSRTGNYLVWFFGAKCNVSTPDSRDCEAAEATTQPQPTGVVNPLSGAVPPGAAQATFPFKNLQLQDVPNNWDYTFRAGIFAGDYSGVTTTADGKAWAVWTDSRNGRSSRNELGRNPACEQSDIFGALVSLTGDSGQSNSQPGDLNAFASAQCPVAAVDDGSHGGNGDHDFHGSHRR
jgi:hypothetical protein